MNPDDDTIEQMDTDFEDYKKKVAEGSYPEEEFVEEDVRRLKEKHPDTPEEALRKLSVAAIASRKRLKQWSRLCATEDMAEPMIKKLFSGDLECVDSLPPIPTLDDDEEDEEETKRKVHDLEQHEKDIKKKQEHDKQLEELGDLIRSIVHLRAEAATKKAMQEPPITVAESIRNWLVVFAYCAALLGFFYIMCDVIPKGLNDLVFAVIVWVVTPITVYLLKRREEKQN
jgi:hypothetical protein